jgi:hypothetical protein
VVGLFDNTQYDKDFVSLLINFIVKFSTSLHIKDWCTHFPTIMEAILGDAKERDREELNYIVREMYNCIFKLVLNAAISQKDTEMCLSILIPEPNQALMDLLKPLLWSRLGKISDEYLWK